MNKLLSFVLLSVLCSCGRKLELTTPGKKPAELKVNQDALTISEFSDKATTFSMFFIPEESELIWESPLYNKSDDYVIKVSKIMKHIIQNSNKFDEVDQKTIHLQEKLDILEEETTDDCLMDDTTEQCQKMQALQDELYVLVDQRTKFLSVIQFALDNSTDRNQAKNWLLTGDDPQKNELRQLEDNTFDINFPQLGPFGSLNSYSTETGEIYDVTLGPSVYSSKAELLKFKIKEKDSNGAYTEMVWEFTLERSFAAGKLRYKGDVLKVDQAGQILRRGLCKIDMAPSKKKVITE